MTTIAFKDGVLAVDTRATGNGTKYNYLCRKLRRTDHFIFASCGTTNDAEMFHRWVESGMPEDGKPEMDESHVSLLVDKNGLLWRFEQNLTPWAIDVFHATGSGMEFAFAAMECGQDAIGAVRVASKFDVYSGVPIQWATFENGSPTQIMTVDA